MFAGSQVEPPADRPPPEERVCCKIDPDSLTSPSPDQVLFKQSLAIGPAAAQVTFDFHVEGELTTNIDKANVTYKNRCRPPRCQADELEVALPWEFKGKVEIKAAIGTSNPAINAVFGTAANATLLLETTWTGMTVVPLTC